MARKDYRSKKNRKSSFKDPRGERGTRYGKAFKKKTSGGKFRKGTMIQYKYVNGRRVGAVKARRK